MPRRNSGTLRHLLMRRLSCLSIEPAAISRRCGRRWTCQTSQPRSNHQSPDQPLKISRNDRPRRTKDENRVVSSPPESCEALLQKIARISNQNTVTSNITTAIARKKKVRTIQASVAHSRKSHSRFIAANYNSSRRVREGPKSNRSAERELLSTERAKHMLPYAIRLCPTSSRLRP